MNRTFARIVGYEPEELEGLGFADITHPADLDVDLEIKARLQRCEIDHYQRAKRYVRKDGSLVSVRLSVTGLRDAAGAVTGHLAQVEDITERLQAEEALRKSESNFRRLFDRASDGILISDVDSRYTDVNAAGCQILGYARRRSWARPSGTSSRWRTSPGSPSRPSSCSFTVERTCKSGRRAARTGRASRSR